MTQHFSDPDGNRIAYVTMNSTYVGFESTDGAADVAAAAAAECERGADREGGAGDAKRQRST